MVHEDGFYRLVCRSSWVNIEMDFDKTKPGQLVEYVGPIQVHQPLAHQLPSVWKAYKFPASHDAVDSTGEIELNIGDRFMILDCSFWKDNFNSTMIDVRILFKGVVKYLDIVADERNEDKDEFRLVSS